MVLVHVGLDAAREARASAQGRPKRWRGQSLATSPAVLRTPSRGDTEQGTDRPFGGRRQVLDEGAALGGGGPSGALPRVRARRSRAWSSARPARSRQASAATARSARPVRAAGADRGAGAPLPVPAVRRDHDGRAPRRARVRALPRERGREVDAEGLWRSRTWRKAGRALGSVSRSVPTGCSVTRVDVRGGRRRGGPVALAGCGLSALARTKMTR